MTRKTRSKERLSAFTPLLHCTMDSSAWLALSPTGKALYPMLKRRVGFNGNQNGNFWLSVRDAAKQLAVDKNTAAKALGELQARASWWRPKSEASASVARGARPLGG